MPMRPMRTMPASRCAPPDRTTRTAVQATCAAVSCYDIVMRDKDGASSDGARPIQPRPAVRPGFLRPEAGAKGVRVLEADPELGIGIGPADWQLALQAA